MSWALENIIERVEILEREANMRPIDAVRQRAHRVIREAKDILVAIGDRCRCSHEEGDSDCPVHPTNPETGEPIGAWAEINRP